MKTTMKKIAAYLLAMLLVFQMLPAMADDNQTTSGTLGPITNYREKLTITAPTQTLTVGMTITLTATESFNKVVWSSDDPEIATVIAKTGEVTAIAPGQARIKATADGHTDSITLRVVDNKSAVTEDAGTVEEKESEESEESYSEAESKEPLIIIINGTKTKETYTGKEFTSSYTVVCDDSRFDESKLSLINEDHLAHGKDCNVYQDALTDEDFSYSGDERVEYVITQGWLQIKPAAVTVKADDATQKGDEIPEFTATITGLMEGDAPETIQYTFDTYTAGDKTYVTPVCEPIQGNYRVTTEPGILTIENGVYRAIKLTSDWPAGEPAYAGTMITMTAELIGFENVDYTLQWQHSVDNKEWINEPGANDTKLTFELNETTVQYTWRVVANY